MRPLKSIMLPRVATLVVAGLLLLLVGFGALAVLAVDAPQAGAVAAPSNESRTPYGEMNLAWSEPGLIGVVGWAKDPDVNRPIDVVVAIDRGLYVRTAGVYNPYLPGKYNEKFRSFLVAIPVSSGPHTMCVAALNVGRGNPFRLLGCKVFDNVPTPDPIGALDYAQVLPAGDTMGVSGWTLDQEKSTSLPVSITVDGAVVARPTANQDRPDIGMLFPGSGAAHGFSVDIGVSPGSHRVCAVAQNIGRGADATLGCRTVDVRSTQPVGNLEVVAVGSNAIQARGWAGDPDAGGSIDVHLTDRLAGSIDDPTLIADFADDPRPDVAAVTGLDARAGFDLAIPVSQPGTHEICLNALNRGYGRNRLIGCQTVVVADHRPTATVERVEPQASGVQVTGWAFDPDAAGSVTVRVSVDGAVTTTTANLSRPDIGAAIPAAGNNRGFQVAIGGLGAGRHTVCVTFVNVGSNSPGLNGDRTPPCGAVIVGATAVGTSGVAGVPIPVGPGGGPLANVDRDAGVSVSLRDGSVLWLFGDSTEYNADGSLKYFVGGTAAWASAAQPTVTRDAVAPSGAPYLLATPGEGYPACSAGRPNRVMWPVSAVKVPDGGRDRIVAFFANMCIGSMTDYEFTGLSLAQWYYDPAAPPVGAPVQFTVINQSLAVARAYGTASVYDATSGFAYLYACDRPANTLDIGGFGPCRVARVDPVHIGEPAFFTYYNGSSWVAGEASAVPLTMPAGASVATRYPAAAFTVAFDSAHGVYVMVYSPWPGFIDRAMVRVSRTPQGPWSEPVEVVFPGCSNVVQTKSKACYAGTAQPAFSTTAELGLGYYDQAIAADRNRGQYMVVRVPFVVALS